MLLTRHETTAGPRWALDGRLLPDTFSLSAILARPQAEMRRDLAALPLGAPAAGPVLAPLDAQHEVWASGVTFWRSREARMAESAASDVYTRVYEAERPELFFKALGWRVVGDGMPIRIRQDSAWNVPEPELVVVLNCLGQIVAYCAGNDVSSRAIEGENPLYLPQAKIYRGACALGPGLMLLEHEDLHDLNIHVEIHRNSTAVFTDETRTANMKRRIAELAAYLFRELDFPHGTFLMTGTGIVPPDSFTLRPGDQVHITIGTLQLRNEVRA